VIIVVICISISAKRRAKRAAKFYPPVTEKNIKESEIKTAETKEEIMNPPAGKASELAETPATQTSSGRNA
ncbi:unnamed protein product, partial [Hymenolepis diminuta]